MTPEPSRRRLPARDPLAVALTEALTGSDACRLTALLAEHPWLARTLIEDEEGGVNAPLHIFADAPGHRPRAAEIVTALARAGAPLDDHATGTWHEETALHWAASNDDTDLIDALADAGADLEAPGSSIASGPPLQSATCYGQWNAARRLVDRGASVNIFTAACLGMLPDLEHLVSASPPPTATELGGALWNASRAGQLAAAEYLVNAGADVNWPAPWSGETPYDAATAGGQPQLAAWLAARSGRPGTPVADARPIG